MLAHNRNVWILYYKAKNCKFSILIPCLFSCYACKLTCFLLFGGSLILNRHYLTRHTILRHFVFVGLVLLILTLKNCVFSISHVELSFDFAVSLRDMPHHKSFWLSSIIFSRLHEIRWWSSLKRSGNGCFHLHFRSTFARRDGMGLVNLNTTTDQ